ncbi:MAG TPA: chloride channel protein [Marmoricola sp.]|nr:chloride channel protein [Marmoricola sp.]
MRTALAAVLTGILAGLTGVLLIALLHVVQHLAFGYTEESFLIGVDQASAVRRVLALTVGGAIAGVGWWIHRRVTRGNVSVTHALRSVTDRMKIAPVAADGLLQIVAVGAGASLGREGAPREIGAAFGDRLAGWFGLDGRDRRILLAAGAGAGLAAVYNVPVSGVAFALEALLLTVRPRALLLAALSSAAATATARVFVGDQVTYRVPTSAQTADVLVASLVIGPACALGALGFRAAMTRARIAAPQGWRSALAITASFASLGVAAIALPEILGNGKSLAQAVFSGPTSLALAAVLVLAKPLATWLCLRSGAIGGLLTPAFATGATLGFLLSHVWNVSGSDTAVFTLMGASAFLAVAQRIPVTAGVLALELTHLGSGVVLPIVLSLVTATLTAHALRRVRVRRLPWRPRRRPVDLQPDRRTVGARRGAGVGDGHRATGVAR